MRKKINKLAKRLHNRHNITAVGIIVVIAAISFTLSFLAFDFFRFRSMENAKEKRHSAYEDEVRKLSGLTTNLTPAPDPTADWKTYENQRYNLSLKYPQNWQAPRETYAGKGENYLLKISFDEKGVTGSGPGKGLEVYIYSATKFSSPIGTDNLKKKVENISNEDCPRFDDITLGENGYPAKEVNISPGNPCWEETFFYSLTKDGYMFNIVPRQGENPNIFADKTKISQSEAFSEFYDIISTLDFPEKESVAQIPGKIIQKATRPAQVRYTAGARCNHKNDHPSYSKTKGKHIDEDCCPDPDEWPNPRCAYSGGQLGVMRAKPKK